MTVKMKTETMCTKCGTIHAWPTPKFSPGTLVQIISNDNGSNYLDKVGAITRIVGVAEFVAMPCNEIEYQTELGQGYIREGRLKKIEERH